MTLNLIAFFPTLPSSDKLNRPLLNPSFVNAHKITAEQKVWSNPEMR